MTDITKASEKRLTFGEPKKSVTEFYTRRFHSVVIGCPFLYWDNLEKTLCCADRLKSNINLTHCKKCTMHGLRFIHTDDESVSVHVFDEKE